MSFETFIGKLELVKVRNAHPEVTVSPGSVNYFLMKPSILMINLAFQNR